MLRKIFNTRANQSQEQELGANDLIGRIEQSLHRITILKSECEDRRNAVQQELEVVSHDFKHTEKEIVLLLKNGDEKLAKLMVADVVLQKDKFAQLEVILKEMNDQCLILQEKESDLKLKIERVRNSDLKVRQSNILSGIDGEHELANLDEEIDDYAINAEVISSLSDDAFDRNVRIIERDHKIDREMQTMIDQQSVQENKERERKVEAARRKMALLFPSGGNDDFVQKVKKEKMYLLEQLGQESGGSDDRMQQIRNDFFEEDHRHRDLINDFFREGKVDQSKMIEDFFNN